MCCTLNKEMKMSKFVSNDQDKKFWKLQHNITKYNQ